MIIGFTGHRDKMCEPEDLDIINQKYPESLWVHGGAFSGFDLQVHTYCQKYSIREKIIRPDYQLYAGKEKLAPLARNYEIVDMVYLLVACYDGRMKGGTYHTVEYAKLRDVPILYVSPIGA